LWGPTYTVVARREYEVTRLIAFVIASGLMVSYIGVLFG